MSKSESHRQVQNKAAGRHGRQEVRQRGNTRLDARNARGTATEVEGSGDPERLRKAGRRLDKARKSGASGTVLQVPQKDMKKAQEAMRKEGVKGSVKNMKGSQRRSVR